MATKLKNLKIKKVDFVDEGANPDAHVRLTKKKDEEQSVAGDGEKNAGIFGRLLSFIGKAAGMNQDEIDSAIGEIQKSDSVSFSEKYNEAKNRKIADEIWDICYALQSSLCSILNDEELDSTSASAAMQKSLDEFQSVVMECITQWSDGKAASIAKKDEEVTEADIALMKSAAERLQAEIRKAEKSGENKKGDKERMEMEIDKSKLTDAERAFLDSIEKRYGTENGGDGGGNTPEPPAQKTESAVKSKTPQETITPAGQDDGGDDIYKGLNPEIQAELEALKKFKEDAEDRELGQIADKYEIIGKKKEDLVPLFKKLRAAGGTAFDEMIAVLDNAVDVVEKSGAFSEVGKSGHGTSAVNEAEQKIGIIAKGYMEKDATLDYMTAVAKAWENNPELMDEYEEQEGF